MKSHLQQIPKAFIDAFPRAIKTAWWIIKIMLPLSLAVGLLQYFGLLNKFSELSTPIFQFIGLSGEASIAFISSIFTGVYAPIAIISSLNLDMREIIILGSMCVISHNMFFECAVQKKAGSNPLTIFIVRIILSFLSAIFLNWILPSAASFNLAHFNEISSTPSTLTEFFTDWGFKNGKLTIKIFFIILGLMSLQNILKAFKIIDFLSKSLGPVMKLMGLSSKTSFLWLVGQTLGLTYGSGIIIEELNKGEINHTEASHLNYHLAINHSQLEDPMLFVAVGAPFFWVSLSRYIFSILVVWIMIAYEKLFQQRLSKALVK